MAFHQSLDVGPGANGDEGAEALVVGEEEKSGGIESQPAARCKFLVGVTRATADANVIDGADPEGGGV